MRVISGKYKGRKLLGFNIDGTRPTMDRVKASLFAMIQDSIKDKLVLDLFAGSGSLGIEALSMGAKKVYFIDNNNKALDIIKKNTFNIPKDDYNIIKSDYLKYLDTNNIVFDIILLDPPYNTDYLEKSLQIILKNDLLSNDGLIVCETNNLNNKDFSMFNIVKERRYGDKYIVILKKIV